MSAQLEDKVKIGDFTIKVQPEITRKQETEIAKIAEQNINDILMSKRLDESFDKKISGMTQISSESSKFLLKTTNMLIDTVKYIVWMILSIVSIVLFVLSMFGVTFVLSGGTATPIIIGVAIFLAAIVAVVAMIYFGAGLASVIMMLNDISGRIKYTDFSTIIIIMISIFMRGWGYLIKRIFGSSFDDIYKDYM